MTMKAWLARQSDTTCEVNTCSVSPVSNHRFARIYSEYRTIKKIVRNSNACSPRSEYASSVRCSRQLGVVDDLSEKFNYDRSGCTWCPDTRPSLHVSPLDQGQIL